MQLCGHEWHSQWLLLPVIIGKYSSISQNENWWHNRDQNIEGSKEKSGYKWPKKLEISGISMNSNKLHHMEQQGRISITVCVCTLPCFVQRWNTQYSDQGRPSWIILRKWSFWCLHPGQPPSCFPDPTWPVLHHRLALLPSKGKDGNRVKQRLTDHQCNKRNKF